MNEPVPMIEDERQLNLDANLCLRILEKIPYTDGDVMYDPFSDNSCFYEFFPDHLHTDSRTSDLFLSYPKTVDWVVCQPSHNIDGLSKEHQRYNFFDLCEYFASANRCKKGFCFLVNNVSYLAITPNRMETLKELGFVLKKQIMVNIKAQRGRSFFMMFMREEIECEPPFIDYILGYY